MADDEHGRPLAREVQVADQLAGQRGGRAGLEVPLQLHQRPGGRLRANVRPGGRVPVMESGRTGELRDYLLVGVTSKHGHVRVCNIVVQACKNGLMGDTTNKPCALLQIVRNLIASIELCAE